IFILSPHRENYPQNREMNRRKSRLMRPGPWKFQNQVGDHRPVIGRLSGSGPATPRLQLCTHHDVIDPHPLGL
ncbi:MAG: hypothetical protein ABSA06_15395, partial [Geobacteraceae bacterium]